MEKFPQSGEKCTLGLHILNRIMHVKWYYEVKKKKQTKLTNRKWFRFVSWYRWDSNWDTKRE